MNKKGCLIYDFREYKPKSVNVGDYVQTLAALNNVDEDWRKMIWVNRENLSGNVNGLKYGEKVNIIMNGWYTHNQETFPLNDFINPLFVSVHLNSSMDLTKNVLETLKKYEPIGCRDIGSVRRLEENGIKAYFSGCLTLTFKKKEVKRKGIVFVIDNLSGISSFREFVRWERSSFIIEELLKQFTIEEIMNAKFLDQTSSLQFSVKKQFKLAEKRLKILAGAELVVTTRIHSLMPSMSLGTPALAIVTDNLDSRFEGLIDFWNIIDYTDYTKTGNVEKRILRDENGKITNNESFREFMKPTVDKIKEFWYEK